jgi:hypothetical protein
MWALASSHTPANTSEALLELKKLVQAEPAIIDLDCLSYVNQGIDALEDDGAFEVPHNNGVPSTNSSGVQLSAVELRTTIWSRAVKAKPKDESLVSEAFFESFLAADWKTAQQVRCPTRDRRSH